MATQRECCLGRHEERVILKGQSFQRFLSIYLRLKSIHQILQGWAWHEQFQESARKGQNRMQMAEEVESEKFVDSSCGQFIWKFHSEREGKIRAVIKKWPEHKAKYFKEIKISVF